MKTLTYGTLPSFEEFETAMNNTFGSDDDDTVRYDIRFSKVDCNGIIDCGIELPMLPVLVDGKPTARLDAEHLYALCEALCKFSEYEGASDVTTEQLEWAGDFCSSILTTLGFEWI